MLSNKLMCQTLYFLKYTMHMGNKPAVFQHNVMCVQISTAIPSVYCNTHFSPFHGHNTNSGPHSTRCNCLQFDFWIICCCPDSQWPTDQDRQCTCNRMLWHKHVTCCHAQAVHIAQSVCLSVFLLQLSSTHILCATLCPLSHVCTIFFHIFS